MVSRLHSTPILLQIEVGGDTRHRYTFAVGESIDPVVLNKLAIQYSDGVIQASRNINSEITDYVQKRAFLSWGIKTLKII